MRQSFVVFYYFDVDVRPIFVSVVLSEWSIEGNIFILLLYFLLHRLINYYGKLPRGNPGISVSSSESHHIDSGGACSRPVV